MGLKIKSHNLGGFPVEGYYTEFAKEPTMAIQTGLPHVRRRAREMEGHGYYRRPPYAGRKFCFAAASEEHVDFGTVRALRRVVQEMEPSWVEAVRDATRMSNETRWIADWCELPIQAVIAILLVLEARGELPEG